MIFQVISFIHKVLLNKEWFRNLMVLKYEPLYIILMLLLIFQVLNKKMLNCVKIIYFDHNILLIFHKVLKLPQKILILLNNLIFLYFSLKNNININIFNKYVPYKF